MSENTTAEQTASTSFSDLPLSPEKLQLYSWHKWAGVSAFLLAVIRLGWRLSHQPPALPASMSAAISGRSRKAGKKGVSWDASNPPK